jgi:hypothetical protein
MARRVPPRLAQAEAQGHQPFRQKWPPDRPFGPSISLPLRAQKFGPLWASLVLESAISSGLGVSNRVGMEVSGVNPEVSARGELSGTSGVVGLRTASIKGSAQRPAHQICWILSIPTHQSGIHQTSAPPIGTSQRVSAIVTGTVSALSFGDVKNITWSS